MKCTPEFLRRVYQEIPTCVDEVDRYIQQITATAYSDVSLVAAEVLGRNPHTTKFFHHVLFREYVRPSRWRVFLKILRYYARIGLTLPLYFSAYLVYRLSWGKRRFDFVDTTRPLYVIDTFVFIHLLQREGKHREICFPHLYEVLEKYDKQFLILPKFLGRLHLFNVRPVMKILCDSKRNFVTEYDLLTFSDLIEIACRAVLYPFSIRRLFKTLPPQPQLYEIMRAEILDTLHFDSMYTLTRYFVGRRLGALTSGQMILINWFENQVIDKILFRGLRETKPDVCIYGAQSFIDYPPYLCARVAEADKLYGMTPDIVLTNGPVYLREHAPVSQRVGVSFRNRDIFFQAINWEAKKGIAIFLPYHRQLSNEIIDLCMQSSLLCEQSLVVTVHPASLPAHFPKLPSSWSYTKQNRFEVLQMTAVIASSESSTIVEATALGTSVVIVASQSSFTCNPMLEAGRGEIWDIAFDVDELEKTYRQLLAYRQKYPQRVLELAKFYKEQCFVEPSEENIVKAFDLR